MSKILTPLFLVWVLGLTVSDFEGLRRHVGHKIECVCYHDGETVYGVSLECLTCGEVLMSFDNPEFVEDCLEDCDEVAVNKRCRCPKCGSNLIDEECSDHDEVWYHCAKCGCWYNAKGEVDSEDVEPICDCAYWGENVYPYFDDGCHIGHSYCNPKECDDYKPIKQKTP